MLDHKLHEEYFQDEVDTVGYRESVDVRHSLPAPIKTVIEVKIKKKKKSMSKRKKSAVHQTKKKVALSSLTSSANLTNSAKTNQIVALKPRKSVQDRS